MASEITSGEKAEDSTLDSEVIGTIEKWIEMISTAIEATEVAIERTVATIMTMKEATERIPTMIEKMAIGMAEEATVRIVASMIEMIEGVAVEATGKTVAIIMTVIPILIEKRVSMMKIKVDLEKAQDLEGLSTTMKTKEAFLEVVEEVASTMEEITEDSKVAMTKGMIKGLTMVGTEEGDVEANSEVAEAEVEEEVSVEVMVAEKNSTNLPTILKFPMPRSPTDSVSTMTIGEVVLGTLRTARNNRPNFFSK